MRQADWQTWLLDEPQREAAQVLFLLHPEWQELTEGSETGKLSITIPSPTVDHEALVLECGASEVTLRWEEAEAQFPLADVREAMRTVESLLWEEAVVISDFVHEKRTESRICRLDAGMPPSGPDTTHRILASWNGTYDQIIRFV